MKWFRFYSEALDDPKVQLLRPELFRLWVNLLCIASENDGYLPDDCHLRVRLRSDRCQNYVRTLTDRGLFDEENGKLRPHNWDARQWILDTNADRQRRFRERQRNVTAVTSDTDTDNRYRKTETDISLTPTPSPTTKLVEENIFAFYEQQFGGRMTPRIEAVLKEMERDYPPNWIEEAFNEAALSQARTLRYVDAVLRNWKAEEDRDLADAQEFGLEGEDAVAYAEQLREHRAQ